MTICSKRLSAPNGAHVCARAPAHEGHHLCECGFGWGGAVETTAEHYDALVDAVCRLLEIDDRRVNVVRTTGPNIADGVRLTQPIMDDYTAVIAELRELMG